MPARGTTSASRETAPDDGGSVSDSEAAIVRSGITTSSDSTARPTFDSSTYGDSAGIRGTTRPSSRAPRTSRPAGISTATQPSIRTSTVRRASPDAASPLARRSYSTRVTVASTGGRSGGRSGGNALRRSARYSSTGMTTQPSGRTGCCAPTIGTAHTVTAAHTRVARSMTASWTYRDGVVVRRRYRFVRNSRLVFDEKALQSAHRRSLVLTPGKRTWPGFRLHKSGGRNPIECEGCTCRVHGAGCGAVHVRGLQRGRRPERHRRAVRPLRMATAADECGEHVLVCRFDRQDARAGIFGGVEDGSADAARLVAVQS